MDLNIEKQALLNLLNVGLLDNDKNIEFDKINYADLFDLADKHSVNMLCFDALKTEVSKIPESVYKDWVYFASRKMAMNENVLLVQKRLTKLLEENDIKYFVFKGLAVSSYYKNYQLRELGDIDFYLDYSNFKKAHFLLKENGFKLISTKGDKHFTYECDGIEVEMHKNFWDMPNNNCAKYLENTIKNSVDNTELVTISDYSFSGPNYVVNAVILVLHIINHVQRGGIGLRQICDFVAFYSSGVFADNLDEILETFKKGGIYKVAQVLAKLSNEYFDAPCYDFFEDVSDDLCDAFLQDVIESGNFGGLSEEKYYGSAALTMNSDKNSNFFSNLFTFCKVAWRPCEKHSFLLPIAPFYIVIRYVFRAIMGKRPKINPIKLTKNSFDRVELYKKLEFFEES